MADIEEAPESNNLELAADIVSAYVSNNSVQLGDLPNLIASVHSALGSLGTPAASAEPEAEKPTPAQIRKSITHDALISFIDGKPYKTLKRHLSSRGHDAYSYRARYGLPSDYPMVAASYAAQRSELAKSAGLGQGGGRVKREAEGASEAPKGRGRPKKGE